MFCCIKLLLLLFLRLSKENKLVLEVPNKEFELLLLLLGWFWLIVEKILFELLGLWLYNGVEKEKLWFGLLNKDIFKLIEFISIYNKVNKK